MTKVAPQNVKPLKILVVDDEVIIAMNVTLVLKEIGFEVPALAHSAIEAMEMARVHRPDLILMDINLKGAGDGIEAAEEIRNTLGIPVIFLTAYSDSENQKRASAASPLGYIFKPVTDHELKNAVMEVATKIYASHPSR